MEPLFQTSGWSLPSQIAAETRKRSSKEEGRSSSTNITKDADQLQAQFNRLGPKPSKNQKKRQQNRGDDQPEKAKKRKENLKQSKDPKTNSKGKQQQQQQQVRQDQSAVTKQQQQQQVMRDQSTVTKQQQQRKTKEQQVKADPKQPPVTKERPRRQEQEKSEEHGNTASGTPSTGVNNINTQLKKKSMDASKKAKLKQLLDKKKTISKNKEAPSDMPILPERADSVVTGTNTKSTVNSRQQAANTGQGLTTLQKKMKDKLSGARFRWLNEKLYTTEGNEAFSLFQEKPELFDEYHEGFRHQVESWPVNPVDVILSQLSGKPKGTVIADLGCGDAVIGHTLKKQKVLSYDLIAKNDKVIACDITKLPLDANAVDIVVFSLSLMGTNYIDFLKEAHRILKPGGEMKIAEVVSRFSDVDGFVDLVESLGFDFMDKDDDNKMFIMFYFTKRHGSHDVVGKDDDEMYEGLSKNQKRLLQQGAGVRTNMNKLRKKSQNLLKPCLYKRR